MGRPSIFSKEYERKMRTRRIRNVTLILIVIIASGAFILRNNFMIWVSNKIDIKDVAKNNVMSFVTNKVKNAFTERKGSGEADLSKDKAEPEKAAAIEESSEKNIPVETSISLEKYYEMKLNNGISVNVIYEENGEDRKFKNASSEGRIYFNISPSGKGIVILDEESQDMFIMDDTGRVVDITKKQYISTSGKEIYNKDEQLVKVPGYIWHRTPKFIDENNIVYISNLPWFNRTEERYIWKVNLTTNEQINILRSAATNLSFDKLTENGLLASIDGKEKYIQTDGKIIE